MTFRLGQRRLVALTAAVLVACSTVSFAAASPKRLTLMQAVALARKNPLVHVAAHRSRAAEAHADEARGGRWPRLTVTSFIAPSPDVRCLDAVCSTTDPRDVAIDTAGIFGGVRVELVQPLYTFGKLDAAIDAASNAAQAASALADGVGRDLELETARAYFALKLARELTAMLQQGLEQVLGAKEKLVQRLEQGDPDTTVQDRLRLETFEAEVRARLSEAREGRATALLALRALVGDAEADADETPLDPLYLRPGDPIADARRASVVGPEMRAARHGVAALESAKRMELARWLPDLVLTGGFNWARAGGIDDPPSAFANDPFNTTTAQVAVVMRWNFEPAAQSARVERAQAELSRGRALLQAADRATAFAVLQAHTRAVEVGRRLEAARAGERSARGWIASVVQADAIGTASAKDLADALLAWFTLQGRRLQSTYDFNLAVLALRRAIGESALPPGRQ